MLNETSEEQFQKHHEMANTHWWFAGLRELVIHFIGKRQRRNLNILDAGCGVGHMLQYLATYGNGYGLEFSSEAIKFCQIRNLKNIVQASVDKIPLKGNFFDAVVCLDVLYHLGVRNDLEALLEFHRILKKDGLLVINVPAYNFLKSGHDVVAQTRYRYTKEELRRKVNHAGFKIIRITYRNSLLFPLALVIRIFTKLLSRSEHQSDLRALPPYLNKILYKILHLENRVIYRMNLPVGLSVFCVAYK